MSGEPVMEAAPWSALDATALRDEIVSGRLDALTATRTALARLDALDEDLNAFLSVDREAALERARGLDRELAAGAEPGLLHGVPVALKANMCFEGRPASCASKMLEGWRAPYSATFVERLLAAGAVPIGSTNMDEFAMGSSGENSAFGPARNPWSRERTPGGSSSGPGPNCARVAGIWPSGNRTTAILPAAAAAARRC